MRRFGTSHAGLTLVLLAALAAGVAWAGIDDAYRHYRKSESKLERNELDEALELVERAIKAHPESGVFQMGIQPRDYFPYYLRGMIRLRMGEADLALEDFLDEQSRGAIEPSSPLNAALSSRIDEARALDNERPEVRITSTEIREFEFVNRHGAEIEEAELLISGTAEDTRSGIRSISVAGREVALTARDGVHHFNETIRVDARSTELPVIVQDAADNVTTFDHPIELPALSLGEQAERIHAVIVGVNEYDRGHLDENGDCTEELRSSCDGRFTCHALSDLSYSVADAQRVAELLYRRGVPERNVTLLVSGGGTNDATRENVEAAIARAREADGDKVLFFFSGHGMLSRDQDNLMILENTRTWECADRTDDEEEPQADDPVRRASPLEETAISVASVARQLKESRSPERYIILDACRTPVTATKSVGTKEIPGFSAEGIKGIRLVLEEVEEDRGRDPIIFYSTLERKVSVEWNTKGSGYFTWFLIQGLRRNLALDELKRFVQAGVKQQTQEDLCGRAQDPELCAYLQAPYLQLPPELEQNYDLQAQTYILGGK